MYPCAAQAHHGPGPTARASLGRCGAGRREGRARGANVRLGAPRGRRGSVRSPAPRSAPGGPERWSGRVVVLGVGTGRTRLGLSARLFVSSVSSATWFQSATRIDSDRGGAGADRVPGIEEGEVARGPLLRRPQGQEPASGGHSRAARGRAHLGPLARDARTQECSHMQVIRRESTPERTRVWVEKPARRRHDNAQSYRVRRTWTMEKRNLGIVHEQIMMAHRKVAEIT